MQRNVDLNFHQEVSSEADNGISACPVQVAELDWGGELPPGVPHEPDLILAADCVYFEVNGLICLVISLQAYADVCKNVSLHFRYWWIPCVASLQSAQQEKFFSAGRSGER